MSQIDGHVEDATLEASDQLHFGMRRSLIVKAAERADSRCTRIVDLRNAAVLHDRAQFLFTEPSGKSATLIDKWCCFHNQHTGQFGTKDLHRETQTEPACRASARY